MESRLLAALIGFAFAATITPGPNNIMVMASGANFGFRRSIPHLCGVSTGVIAVILLAGIGLVTVFEVLPSLEVALRVVSAIYLLWLAWRVANALPPGSGPSDSTPLSFLQAATFQWINPKVWATGLSAIILFSPERSFGSVMGIALAFAATGFASNAIWTWMGTVLRVWLTVGNRLRVFNAAMALLLVASLYPVLIH